MSSSPSTDPMGFFRDMLAQWEKTGNEMGNKLMGSDQFAEIMGKGTMASVQLQSAINDGMGKALSVANMPSKADIEALAMRMGAVEKQLHRIEAMLSGTAPSEPARPAVSRGRKRPEKS
jgi:polyhydroxyalkanoate synthesis regulator phasin